jgi:hypothetical protein
MNREASIEDVLRIQALSPTLIRVEERGRAGFEDRPSFYVINREGPGAHLDRIDREGGAELSTDRWRIMIEGPQPTIENLRIHDARGALLFDGSRPIPTAVFLPNPSDAISSWAFLDAPRIIPPPWGALPPPPDIDDPFSGWDFSNQARDAYIFLPQEGGYARVVADFLALTGRIPLPPLCALGVIDSRYHPYNQQEALEIIDTFRRLRIPLDVFVLDTDWRVGASHGYEVNTALFPDLPGFVREAHARGVRVMLNDHPEPRAPSALAPEELRYRYAGLSSLMEMGIDYWWFDRNWRVSLTAPAPGITKEVWGMRLYYEVTRAVRPRARPMVLSNVEGIDNGVLNGPPSPAAHRFPIWWTGDTSARWRDLERGVRNAVDGGVRSLLPFISEDLGGHLYMPDQELYARFMQFGAFSPICRLHCTAGMYRHPWRYGEAGEIAAEYFRLRHRLLPTIYAAAHETHAHGRPILRRCDLEWPAHVEARASDQYLFGADLLVAPIIEPTVPLEPIPATFLSTADGRQGVEAEYFNGDRVHDTPSARRIEADICHAWHREGPAPLIDRRRFAARWETRLGPIPESGMYRLALHTQGLVRMWLDGELTIDCADPLAPVLKFADVYLHRGAVHRIRIEYAGTGSWGAHCEFLWGRHRRTAIERSIWIPPGEWQDIWSGETISGPLLLTRCAALTQIPLFARAGGAIFSIPLRTSAGAAFWPELTIDLFAHAVAGAQTREIIEDDGYTVDYEAGAVRRTRVLHARDADRIILSIEASRGTAPNATSERTLTLRWHGLERKPSEIYVNERPFDGARWTETKARLPIEALAEKAGAIATRVLEIKPPTHKVDTPLLVELRGF